MNDKVACAIASICSLFFLFAGLDQAADNHPGAALVGVGFAAVLLAVAVFASLNARPLKAPY